MSPSVAYGDIADWYEQEFLASTAGLGEDPLGELAVAWRPRGLAL